MARGAERELQNSRSALMPFLWPLLAAPLSSASHSALRSRSVVFCYSDACSPLLPVSHPIFSSLHFTPLSVLVSSCVLPGGLK